MHFLFSLLVLFSTILMPIHSRTTDIDKSYAALNSTSNRLSLNVIQKNNTVANLRNTTVISPTVSKPNDSCCLKGSITWETNVYKTETILSLPLINAKIELYLNRTKVSECTTDDEGNYNFSLTDKPDVWSNLSNCKLNIVLQSSLGVLYTRYFNSEITSGSDYFPTYGQFNFSNTSYGKANYFIAGRKNIPVTDTNPNSNTSVIKSLNYKSTTIPGQFFQLYTMMQLYAKHARKLNSGMQNGNIPTCKLIYPCEVNDTKMEENQKEYTFIANYVYLDQVIRVPYGRNNPANPNMYSYSSWDLIGHEYGHHLEQFMGFSRYAYGKHDSYKDDSKSQDIHAINANDNHSMSELGRNLAWNESWPTFFSIASQKSFPTLFTENIYALGDDKYDAYNYTYSGGDMPLTSINGYIEEENDGNIIAGGDACEDSIMRFLYQLWDGTFDTINDEYSEKKLWADVCYAAKKGAENFSEFYDYLFLFHSWNRLRELAALHKMSATKVTKTLSTSLILSWDGKINSQSSNETVEKLSDGTIEQSYYLIHVCNEDEQIIFTMNNGSLINDTSYQLTEKELESVSGQTLLLTIEKITYNIDENQEKTFISDFVTNPFSISFPIYAKK